MLYCRENPFDSQTTARLLEKSKTDLHTLKPQGGFILQKIPVSNHSKKTTGVRASEFVHSTISCWLFLATKNDARMPYSSSLVTGFESKQEKM